jgi:hypothetical protein
VNDEYGVADQRVIGRDVGRAIPELPSALHLPQVRLDRQFRLLKKADRRNACRTVVLPRRDGGGFGAREPADDEGQIANRLRRPNT